MEIHRAVKCRSVPGSHPNTRFAVLLSGSFPDQKNVTHMLIRRAWSGTPKIAYALLWNWVWRRKRDSNSRIILLTYSLSRGAPYSLLGTSPYSGGDDGNRTRVQNAYLN